MLGNSEQQYLKQDHILVLMGGDSLEREVSLASGKAIVRSLKNLGYGNVSQWDLQKWDLWDFVEGVKNFHPQVIFNGLHGSWGEDGHVQSVLDWLKIPYTHSGMSASNISMNKALTKNLASHFGIHVAPHGFYCRIKKNEQPDFPKPWVVKPVYGGSSKNLMFIAQGQDIEVGDDLLYLVEPYIEGREFTVVALSCKSQIEALTVTEIIHQKKIYDYQAKYESEGTQQVCPAKNLSEKVFETLKKSAIKVHEILGCRGMTRCDFLYDGEHCYFLEINIQPGLTETSLAPRQFLAQGRSFEDLIEWVLQQASHG